MRHLVFVGMLGSLAVLVACGASTPGNSPAGPSRAASPREDASTSSPPSRVSPAKGMCGGLAGFSCEKGLYCSFPLDAMCGAADQTGTCEPVPEVCTEEFSPVCGCNDKKYPNACHAAREGISVRKGECGP